MKLYDYQLFLMKKALLEKKQLSDRFDEFALAYKKEIHSRKDFDKALSRLEYMVEDGKKIVLFDDCNLKQYCHLNILGQELIKLGYKVEFLDNKFVNFSF